MFVYFACDIIITDEVISTPRRIVKKINNESVYDVDRSGWVAIPVSKGVSNRRALQ